MPLYEIIPLEAVVGTCCVLDLYTYCKGKETGSEITFGSCVEMVPAAQRQQAASRCCLWHQGCDLCCAGGEEAAAGRCCGKGGKSESGESGLCEFGEFDVNIQIFCSGNVCSAKAKPGDKQCLLLHSQPPALLPQHCVWVLCLHFKPLRIFLLHSLLWNCREAERGEGAGCVHL